MKSAALGRTLPLLMNLSDQSVSVPLGGPTVEVLMARFLGWHKFRHFGHSVTPEATPVGPAFAAHGENIAFSS